MARSRKVTEAFAFTGANHDDGLGRDRKACNFTVANFGPTRTFVATGRHSTPRHSSRPLLVRYWRLSWLALVSTLGLAPDLREFEKATAASQQLIVVTTENWSDNHGALALFERASDQSWRCVSPEMPGRNGLAWGIGLHRTKA